MLDTADTPCITQGQKWAQTPLADHPSAAEERRLSFLHWQVIAVEVRGVALDPHGLFSSHKLHRVP